MRRWAIRLGLIMLALTACAPVERRAEPPGSPALRAGRAGPQEYTVLMGPDTSEIQLNAYFPAAITARPGDAIVFDNRSLEAHTITFGVTSDPLEWPQLKAPSGEYNPVLVRSCVTDQAPTVTMTSCPEQPIGPPPAFGGQGLWTSGVLLPSDADAPAQAKMVRLELAQDIAPGRYLYVCLIHPSMAGIVQVETGADATPSPAQVIQAGQEAQAEAFAAAQTLTPPKPAVGAGVTISAGWGNGIAAINRFAPATVTVPVGTTVTWTVSSPAEGHLVTFGQLPFPAVDPAADVPAGVAPGGEYTGGFAHSGYLTHDPRYPSDSYALRFTRPGTYHYVCLLHPGMEGDVVVTQ